MPILAHDQTVVQGSGAIISYLDRTFPDNPLTPEVDELRRAALEWEAFADEEIGVNVPLICYHVLLEHPDVVIPLFTQGDPPDAHLLEANFPSLRAMMREHMNINADTAAASQDRIDRALDKIETQRNGHDYLLGNQFTRADLTVAALLAPLFQPTGYGLTWPSQTPPDFTELTNRYADRLTWPQRLYQHHR